MIAAIGDKFVVDSNDEFSSFCDLDELLDDITKKEDDDELKVDGTEDVDGEEAVKVDGTTDEGNPSSAYIKVDGDHYILRVESTGETDSGEATFSDFDEEFDVEAPAADDVVDLDALS
ncbi:MAG: hypothetical protein WKF79_03980 [Nocardioides sp.]